MNILLDQVMDNSDGTQMASNGGAGEEADEEDDEEDDEDKDNDDEAELGVWLILSLFSQSNAPCSTVTSHTRNSKELHRK